MRIVLAMTAVAALTISASAQDMKSIQTATELGSVLASEELCKLSFDQAAIAAYIEANVAADDMSFPSTLTMMISGSEYQLSSLSGSALTAHCTQIARIAKSYNFVQ